MYINKISPYTFNALIPKDEYLKTGKPTLKLTPDDEEQIKKIKSYINELERNLDSLKKMEKKYNNKQNYLNAIIEIEEKIATEKEKIKKIKQNRLQMQILLLKKLHQKR